MFSIFSFSYISANKILTLCQQESGWGSISQWSLKLMEVFLRCGEGDKKFIVFPAREMSADSLSCPPCKTSTDRTLRITHYVSLRTHCVCTHGTQWTVELAGIRRKETKRLGVPPTLINIKSLRRLLDWTRHVFYFVDYLLCPLLLLQLSSTVSFPFISDKELLV